MKTAMMLPRMLKRNASRISDVQNLQNDLKTKEIMQRNLTESE